MDDTKKKEVRMERDAKPNFMPDVTQWDDDFAVCPYCGHQEEDPWDWIEESRDRHRCEACGREYIAYAEHSITYRTEPTYEK